MISWDNWTSFIPPQAEFKVTKIQDLSCTQPELRVRGYITKFRGPWIPPHPMKYAPGSALKCLPLHAAMECVGPSQRTWVGIGMEIFWAIGTMLLAGFAYLLPNFQDLQLAMSLPLLIFIPYFW
jgi:hypothetical protein